MTGSDARTSDGAGAGPAQRPRGCERRRALPERGIRQPGNPGAWVPFAKSQFGLTLRSFFSPCRSRKHARSYRVRFCLHSYNHTIMQSFDNTMFDTSMPSVNKATAAITITITITPLLALPLLFQAALVSLALYVLQHPGTLAETRVLAKKLVRSILDDPDSVQQVRCYCCTQQCCPVDCFVNLCCCCWWW